MQRIEILKRKMTGAGELRSIVRTMKVIASVSIRQFEEAVESLGEYYRTVELGLRTVLMHALPEVESVLETGKKSGTGWIVFGAGQGLCGSFDQVMADYLKDFQHREPATESNGEDDPPHLYVLGDRLAWHLKESGFRVDGIFDLPGTTGGINESVSELLEGIGRWETERGIGSILLFHNKPVEKNRFSARHQNLLPLDRHWLGRLTEQRWPTNNIPQFGMDVRRLFSSLLRQYLFVSIYRAIAESLAAEHAGRMNAMQAAEQKIEERIRGLENRYRELRQTAITEELLDIMAGFEAVR